jgi:Natural resistance-associated macrophage protein
VIPHKNARSQLLLNEPGGVAPRRTRSEPKNGTGHETFSGRLGGKETLASIFNKLGPRLVTGASDDDPSGIATYPQVGAQFGYGMLWTMLISYPLMGAIQEISARVGRVTGGGISANLRRCYPRWLLYSVVGLMVAANCFNLGADIGAMGAAAQMLVPLPTGACIFFFGIVSLGLQLFVPYISYAKYLKWLTVSLFAYVATAFFRKRILALGFLGRDPAARASGKGIPDRAGCRVGHDDQSVSVLLASLAGSRRSEKQARRKSPEEGTP